jgi:hypothetical protein
MKLFVVLLASIAWIVQAQAVSMSEAYRACYSDVRKLCPNLGHGTKMQVCLNVHFVQLSPSCQKIVVRLNRGEKITLF